MRVVSIVFVLGVSCYNPKLVSGGYSCQQDGICPEGLVCRNGLCRLPGETGDAPDLPGADMSVPVPDLAQGDMASAPDLPAPPADLTPQPCVSGGVQVGKDIWACMGKFDTGKFRDLCGTGYKVCTTGAGIKFERMMADEVCEGVAGFFAVDVQLSYNLDTNGNAIMTSFCNDDKGRVKAVLGCGAIATPRLPAACRALRMATACGMATAMSFRINGWTCTAGLGDARNDDMNNGVLCCKD